MTDYVSANRRRPRLETERDDSTVFYRTRSTQPDLDVVLTLLSDRRRRIVLNGLRGAAEEWVTVDDLADRIAAWEAELADPATVSERSIEIDLVHGHLPKLDEAGVIDYDGDERRAVYRGDDSVERFLDLAERVGPLP